MDLEETNNSNKNPNNSSKNNLPLINGSLPKIEAFDIAFYYEEMVRSNLVELNIETPNGKITLKRYQKEVSPKTVPLRRRSDFSPENGVPVSSSLKVISSPIIGVFYCASSPQSAPFVKEGKTVEAGATLCIVEAMKVMNEIKSDIRCKVVRILAENGKPVSKGQSLFEVEPM